MQDEPAQARYHPKRPHKKTRTGCRDCKKRRVKCDEARPTCRQCRQRKAKCEYAISRHTLAPSPDCLVRSSPSIVVGPQPRPDDTFDQTDMKLLWFYTTATCSCFSLQSGKQRPVEDIMRTLVVRHAFEAPFLMHSLFALASLHLQSLGQSISPQRALTYRAKSFAGYRSAVQEAKPETFPALLANSLLLTVLATQDFREPDGKRLYIIEWMLLWQGIGPVAGLVDISSIPSAELEPLFHRPAIDVEAAAAAAAIPDHLVTMVASMQPGDADFLDTQTYLDTLQHLGSLYYNLRKGLGAIMTLRIITWLTYLPRQFVELVRSKRPRALVIMAHYAAFLKVVAGIWWMAGVGHRSIRDILDYLGHGWRQHVEMPLRTMDFDDATQLARVISGDALPSRAVVQGIEEDGAKGFALCDDAGQRVQHGGNFALINPNAPGVCPAWNS